MKERGIKMMKKEEKALKEMYDLLFDLQEKESQTAEEKRLIELLKEATDVLFDITIDYKSFRK